MQSSSWGCSQHNVTGALHSNTISIALSIYSLSSYWCQNSSSVGEDFQLQKTLEISYVVLLPKVVYITEKAEYSVVIKINSGIWKLVSLHTSKIVTGSVPLKTECKLQAYTQSKGMFWLTSCKQLRYFLPQIHHYIYLSSILLQY